MSIPRNQSFIWGIHLVIYFVYLGVLTTGLLPFSPEMSKFLAVAWLGILSLHAMGAFGAFSGDAPRKREEEKPKRRLELSDDGELVEVDDSADDEAKRKRLRGE